MAGEDNVVVANGFRQEIRGRRSRQLKNRLRPAKIRLSLAAKKFPFADEVPGQIPGDLEYSNRPGRKLASYSDTDPGLEMSVQPK